MSQNKMHRVGRWLARNLSSIFILMAPLVALVALVLGTVGWGQAKESPKGNPPPAQKENPPAAPKNDVEKDKDKEEKDKDKDDDDDDDDDSPKKPKKPKKDKDD